MEVQRGRTIVLLMQDQRHVQVARQRQVQVAWQRQVQVARQRQVQVARHFGVHVSTIERLVRRLRDTGRVADRLQSRRPRVTVNLLPLKPVVIRQVLKIAQ